MRSSERLPLPRGWQPRSRGVVLAAVCAPVLALLVLRPAIPTLGTPAWATGATVLAGTVLLLVGAYGIVRSGWHRAGVRVFELDEKAGATRIRYSLEVVVIRIVVLASTAAFFGLLGVLALTYSFVGPGVLLFAFGLAFLAWLVGWWLGGIQVGTLTLGPTGASLRVNNRDRSARWEDVIWAQPWDATPRGGLYRRIGLRARHVAGWTAPTRHEWLLGPRSSEPSIDIRCDLIDVDPVLLHSWLQFYIDHPAARSELGTPASLARAQAADFSH